jgi:Lrp/AsnC family leucine-responsive transcriptional regulator
MKYSAQLTRRILHAYDLDARQSYAALARKVGPSKDIIRRTILDFEQDQTIRGYITVIDIGKLGFTGSAVYARLDTADQSKQARLLRHLQERQDIYWIALLGGRYDILFAIQSSSLVQFSDILSDIQRRFPFVTNAQFAIRTRATQFQRAYLSERSAGRVQGGFEVSDQKQILTAREKQVLGFLIENPRIQVVELARLAKISRITAQSTLDRLQKNGVIQGYSALIDCRKLGLESHLVLVTLKRFDQATRSRIRKFAAVEPGIIFCIESIGPWQTEFHCEVTSQQKLQDLLRRFRSEFPGEIAGLEVIAGLDYYTKYRYTL